MSVTVANCHLTAASKAAEESYLMISPGMTRRPGMSLLAGGRMATLPAPRRGDVSSIDAPGPWRCPGWLMRPRQRVLVGLLTLADRAVGG